MSLRLLLPTRHLKPETSGLLVGSNGDLSPVTLKTRVIGAQVELVVLVGETEPARRKPHTARPMGRGPVVPVPDGIKDALRARLEHLSVYTIAEKVGCSATAISSLADGQDECRKALLDAVAEYLGDLANA